MMTTPTHRCTTAAQPRSRSRAASLPPHEPAKATETDNHYGDSRFDPLALQLELFLQDAQAANRARGTLIFYQQKLGPFLDHLRREGVHRPEEIGPVHLRSFMSALADGHTPGGCHAYWRAMRAFLRFLLREEVLEKDPLIRVRAPKVDLEPLESVDQGVVGAILATCDKSVVGLRDRSLVLTLLDTGLRAGEACALNIMDIDLTNGAIIVRHSKNRKPRTVFVGKQARRALTAYLAARDTVNPEDPLWLAYDRGGGAQRFSYTGLRDVMRRRASRAGVPAPALHSFRRGFAIMMLRAGADVVTLSRMMGHGSLPVLMRYLNQQSSDLQRVHEVCSPADQIGRAAMGQR